MGALGRGVDKLLGYEKRRQAALKAPPRPAQPTAEPTTLYAPSAERRAL